MRYGTLLFCAALCACSDEGPIDQAGYDDYANAQTCLRVAQVGEWQSRTDPDMVGTQTAAKATLERARERYDAAAKRIKKSEQAMADDMPAPTNDDFGREVAAGDWVKSLADCKLGREPAAS